NGVGNIANAPLFVDTNGWSDLRLQSNSPCINAGLNAFAPSGPDLDGNPRIQGRTVDIGAYEFQSNALSVLRMLSPVTVGTNVTVAWQSVAGVNYFLERSVNLTATPPFTTLATNLVGQTSTTTYTDTNAVGSGPFFYRVGVSN